MPLLHDMKTRFAASAAAALLAACGGGSGDAPPASTEAPAAADPVDKYVGTWEILCHSWRYGGMPGDPDAPDNRSTRALSVVTKLDAHRFSSVTTQYDYTDDTTCSGTAAIEVKEPDTLEWWGTKTVDGVEVDRLYQMREPWPVRAIARVVDDRLYSVTADIGTPTDAQGFPLALDSTRASSVRVHTR